MVQKTKVYILLFTYSYNDELLPNRSTKEFIVALTRLIARGGRASVTYSDNTKAFVVDSKWFGKINKDEKYKNTSSKSK